MRVLLPDGEEQGKDRDALKRAPTQLKKGELAAR